jgi:hypothetical protein
MLAPPQVVIMVVDSTDVKRLHLSKKELHTMMEHEVRAPAPVSAVRMRADVVRAAPALSSI